MGVRSVVSTYAFLKGLQDGGAAVKKLFCVDIESVDFSPEKEMAAKFGDEAYACASVCMFAFDVV